MRQIPYGRQWLDDDDIEAVVEVLRSDWLTTGPGVDRFEEVLSDYCGVRQAVAVSSGTSALHLLMMALGIGDGDEVIVTPLTFAASANCILYVGATPVFADVCADTLLLSPEAVAEAITERTRAVIAVDYAGQPCDYAALREVVGERDIVIVADACHALGGAVAGRKVGALADCSCFSFHPVKPITTGEGGAITTDDPVLADRLRQLRNHGITTDHRQRSITGTWRYDMVELGYNYRMTDFQSALGTCQLAKLDDWVARRERIARRYRAELKDLARLRMLVERAEVVHGRHLFPVRVPAALRDVEFQRLRDAGVGVNVHYLPVYLHSYYQGLGYEPGICPEAELAASELLSLPIFPALSEDEQSFVIETLKAGLR